LDRDGYDDHCIVERADGRSRREAQANAALIGLAPWYKLIARINATHGWSLFMVRSRRKLKVLGWKVCPPFGTRQWAWQGGVDAFGAPVPPTPEMFAEIEQAIDGYEHENDQWFKQHGSGRMARQEPGEQVDAHDQDV
jgi:hypothetical protein